MSDWDGQNAAHHGHPAEAVLVDPEDVHLVVAWIVEVCDPDKIICERWRLA